MESGLIDMMHNEPLEPIGEKSRLASGSAPCWPKNLTGKIIIHRRPGIGCFSGIAAKNYMGGNYHGYYDRTGSKKVFARYVRCV
jgi:hypothetical protein